MSLGVFSVFLYDIHFSVFVVVIFLYSYVILVVISVGSLCSLCVCVCKNGGEWTGKIVAQ